MNIIPLYKENTVSHNIYNNSILIRYIFVFLILIIFIGFRGLLYTDWQNYYQTYKYAPTLFDGDKMLFFFSERKEEKGFLIFTIICKTISSNYFFFQFISFIIDLFILYYFFKRIIPKYIVLGFLFFILFSGLGIEFNLLRNSKSIMLFIISLKYLEKKNFIKYLICNIIGLMFHAISLLFIPLYFIIDKKFSRIIILTLFFIGNLLFLLHIEWCKPILTYISNIISGRIEILIKQYLSSTFYSKAYGISIGYLERLLSFFIIYYFSKKLCNLNKNNIIYINIFYLYIFIFLYFSEMTIILERIAILFIFPYWIIYPQIYALLRKSYKQIYLFILLLFGLLKIGVGNRNILTFYDNILFQYKSYQERLEIVNQHSKYIYK